MTNPETDRDRIAEALLDYLSRTADIRPGRSGDLAFVPEVTDAERMAMADAVLSALGAAAVSVPPPAPRADDQAVLRQRIAEVLWPLTEWDGDQLNAERAADAVLAVLPEPADRAALDRVRALHQPVECVNVRCKLKQWCIGCDPDGIEGCDENPWPCPTIRALDGEQPTSGPCVAGEQQNETPEAETPTTTKPAASPSVVDEVVAALQAKAQALSVEAEEEMRRDLEDQAQVWHEAADLARRTGRKAVRNAQPTAKPETDGEGAATRFNWSDIIPAPVDETAQERDRLIDCVNRVRVALRDCKERAATGMQYEIAVREAIGDREPRRGPGPLCHESDPRTLRECALKAKHDGDHEDGDLSWPRSAEHQPAAGVRQDGAQP